MNAPDQPALWDIINARLPVPLSAIDPDTQAYVQVNHARWVVSCPFCTSAAIASFTDRRFWCIDCRMTANGGRWVAVVWPDNVDEIERELMRRPNANQNWRVGENVALLRADNNTHAGELT